MEDRPVLEIEITPEMIEAGFSYARWFNPMIDGWELILPGIYRAMVDARAEAASIRATTDS